MGATNRAFDEALSSLQARAAHLEDQERYAEAELLSDISSLVENHREKRPYTPWGELYAELVRWMADRNFELRSDDEIGDRP